MNHNLVVLRRACYVALVWGVFQALPAWAQQPGTSRAGKPGPAQEMPGVTVARDLEYAKVGGRTLLLDLYLPEGAEKPLPLIVWVHGGGWAAGDKNGCPARRMTERGYAVASVDYRLSGEAIFPAQIEDCKAAIRWLRANAGKYRIDPDHIGVWGSSAGGHLVALLGTSGDVKEFDRGENLGHSSRVQAVCDYYGPTDLLQMDAHAISAARMKHDTPSSPESRLIGGPIQENKAKAARANPITYVSADDPSFLIVHGDQDRTVPIHQSQLLFEALKKAGVDVRFHTIRGAGHGQGFGGRDVEEMVNGFFDRCLKPASGAIRTAEAMQSESAAVGLPQTPSNAPGQGPAARRPPFTFEQILAREDANRDGRVTRAEFKGPPPLFDRLDRNHDGVLTKEDFADSPSAPDKPSAEPKGGGQRSAFAEPQWLMPPVTGQHLHYKTFDSKAAGGKVSYLIYLPPDYDKLPTRRYPVVYWLHGIGGSQQGVPAMAERLTKAIQAGQTPPMIVVYVNGMIRSSYVDSANGKWPVETVAIKELIPHVDATYRTIATREGRMVEGFSMGGGGAAKWGFKFPEFFAAVSILAGALHDSPEAMQRRDGGKSFQEIYGSAERFQEHNPWKLVEKNAGQLRGRTTIRIVVGGKDALQETNRRFHELLDRLNLRHEFHVVPDAPHSPNPLYDGLGEKNWAFHRAAFASALAGTTGAGKTETPRETPSAPREPGAGLLYYAKADFALAENQNVIANPHVCGALFQVIWSEVEKEKGKCDWSELDRWIAPWLKANKKVAIRLMWVTSGNWPKPYYKTPTPQWVWREGAKFAFHAASGTEIPLVWDPIYQKHAWQFLEQFAARYDGNPNLLFVDVTPGAETNPYRFARINATHPEFKDQFEKIPASDRRSYNDELWLETVKQWVDASARLLRKTPLLVTLNVGGLHAADRSVAIGDYCVAKGFYVGQNGLTGRSYLDSSGGRTAAFHRWAQQTKLFFEMVAGSGGRTGTPMEVMQAAERIGCSYLNVYPEDVLRATRGQVNFDPEYERALAYGARVLGGKPTSPTATEVRQSPPAQTSSAPAARPDRARPLGAVTVSDFQLQGEKWTCQVDGHPLSGILVKPQGKGPFPAVVISHGLGGSAESFSLSKAREMVTWGLLCIATNYTHTRGGGDRAQFGASEENIRRATACLEILRSLGYVDMKRVRACGNSMGAFLTIGLAGHAADQIAAAAITAGGVAPMDGVPAPSVETAARVRAPFLILHGTADTTVPPERSALLKQVLDGQKVSNDRRLFEGVGHNLHAEKADEVYRLMREWFTKHGILKPHD